MRKGIFLLFLIVLSSFALAAPSFSNHQFYGDVKWSKTSATPQKVNAKIGAITFSSVIKASPCLTAVCTGKYGYDTDNILRVNEGKDGEVITLYVDNVKVTTILYKNGESTELDLSVVGKTIEPKPLENKTIVTTDTTKNDTAVDTKVDDVKTNTTIVLKNGSVVNETKPYVPTKLPVKETPKKTITDTTTGSSGTVTKPTPKPLPAVSGDVESCSDGVKNQEEEGIDCGGVCDECETISGEEDEGISIWVYVGG